MVCISAGLASSSGYDDDSPAVSTTMCHEGTVEMSRIHHYERNNTSISFIIVLLRGRVCVPEVN